MTTIADHQTKSNRKHIIALVTVLTPPKKPQPEKTRPFTKRAHPPETPQHSRKFLQKRRRHYKSLHIIAHHSTPHTFAPLSFVIETQRSAAVGAKVDES